MSVRINDGEGRAGGFARARFVDRRRAWRRRVWWAFPLIAIVPIIVVLPLAALTGASHVGFLIGFGLGSGVAAAMMLFDSPPRYIESWRVGYDGEEDTARKLRRLVNEGWTLFNDIATAYGNVDHVLVGPPGVFLLESKRLSGRVRVEAGSLVVCWHEDPEDGYENRGIAGRARGAAFDLHACLRDAGFNVWVQPVVVIWGDFEQTSVECDRVEWVRGDAIAAALVARLTEYAPQELERLASATRAALQRLDQQPRDAEQCGPTALPSRARSSVSQDLSRTQQN